jgi:Fic family protein
MTAERATGQPAGQIVRVGQGDGAYRAFVPHPLPPELALDLELARTLSGADRALGELAGLGRTLTNPNLLIRPFVRREAVLSSRIEGTQANIADLYALEARQLPLPGLSGAPPEDVQEVANYVHALEYGLERLDTLPVSLRFIRELHERLMAGVRGEHATPGEFRRSQNWIGAPGCTLNDATYVPPPPAGLLDALDGFESYLHAENSYPPLMRLAFIHYQFEAVHPFLDGNGRIGRLLIVLLLVHWELLPWPLLYLSAYLEQRRSTYYDLLLAVSQHGAWREWIVFFLQGVTEQARDAIGRAKRLQDLQTEWLDQLTREAAPVLALRLVNLLFDTPLVSVSLVEERLGCSNRAARLNVQKLIRAGILQPIGDRAYGRWYRAVAILQIIDGNSPG